MAVFSRVLLMTSALVAMPAASAVQSSGSPSRHLRAIGACRAVTVDVDRLACFDREAGALIAAAQRGQLSVVDRAELQAVRRSLFGFSLPKLGMFEREGKSELMEQKDLSSEVLRAVSIGGGRYRVVIADQKAVWETTEASLTGLLPRTGDKVHIKKGALGSYFIRLGSQSWVKGRRVG